VLFDRRRRALGTGAALALTAGLTGAALTGTAHADVNCRAMYPTGHAGVQLAPCGSLGYFGYYGSVSVISTQTDNRVAIQVGASEPGPNTIAWTDVNEDVIRPAPGNRAELGFFGFSAQTVRWLGYGECYWTRVLYYKESGTIWASDIESPRTCNDY
jgi:hypothetical protein